MNWFLTENARFIYYSKMERSFLIQKMKVYDDDLFSAYKTQQLIQQNKVVFIHTPCHYGQSVTTIWKHSWSRDSIFQIKKGCSISHPKIGAPFRWRKKSYEEEFFGLKARNGRSTKPVESYFKHCTFDVKGLQQVLYDYTNSFFEEKNARPIFWMKNSAINFY